MNNERKFWLNIWAGIFLVIGISVFPITSCQKKVSTEQSSRINTAIASGCSVSEIHNGSLIIHCPDGGSR